MLLQPYNFCYFITLFSIAIIGGVYLLLTNKHNILLFINAFLFFLCAIRIGTEYYIHQIDDFSVVHKIVQFHRVLFILIGFGSWYIVWQYVRPFKYKKWEGLANQVYLWGLLILPILILTYWSFCDYFFEVTYHKIDGLWKFSLKNVNLIPKLTQYFILLLMSGITLLVMITEIRRKSKQRIQKIIATACFFLLPLLIRQTVWPTTLEAHKLANHGLFILIMLYCTTWFVSDYRLFYNSFQKNIKDLLDSISDLAFFTDTKLTIIHTNHLAEKVFDSSSINQTIMDLLANYSQTSAKGFEELVDRLNKDHTLIEEIRLNIDGKDHVFLFKSAKFEQGNLHLGYTFLLTDITEIRDKEQQLQQANVTKDQLFAIISHDLRKPALAFRGISQKVRFLLEQKEFDTLDKYGSSLEKSANSLNSLLDNLLKWALQQRDMLPYRPISINVAEVTEEIIDLFERMAAEKNILLKADIPEKMNAFVDQNAYETIIRNLIDNAIKFTKEGGSVELKVNQLDAKIILKVKDSGVGIAKEKLPAIFELHKQKSTRGTAGEEGTGLGLSLVKDLVALNKGSIKVQSQRQQGTTFEILLPAA